jgi:hypothetical protein
MSCGNFPPLLHAEKPSTSGICDAEQNFVLLLVDLDSEQNITVQGNGATDTESNKVFDDVWAKKSISFQCMCL